MAVFSLASDNLLGYLLDLDRAQYPTRDQFFSADMTSAQKSVWCLGVDCHLGLISPGTPAAHAAQEASSIFTLQCDDRLLP